MAALLVITGAWGEIWGSWRHENGECLPSVAQARLPTISSNVLWARNEAWLAPDAFQPFTQPWSLGQEAALGGQGIQQGLAFASKSVVFTASEAGQARWKASVFKLNHARHIRLTCLEATHWYLGWAGLQGLWATPGPAEWVITINRIPFSFSSSFPTFLGWHFPPCECEQIAV